MAAVVGLAIVGLDAFVFSIAPFMVEVTAHNETGGAFTIERVTFDGRILKEYRDKVEAGSTTPLFIDYGQWKSPGGIVEITLRQAGRESAEGGSFPLYPRASSYGTNLCTYDVYIRERTLDVDFTGCVRF